MPNLSSITSPAPQNSPQKPIKEGQLKDVPAASPTSTSAPTATTDPKIAEDLSKEQNPSPEKQNNVAEWIKNNKKQYASYANYFQAFANAFSFISKFPFLKSLKSFGEKLGSFGTKAFLLVNGGLNAAQLLIYKNYTGALGYLINVYNSIFTPQDKTYICNGPAVGFTQWANQVNNVTKRAQYTSALDHFKNLFKGTLQIFKDSWRNPVKAALEGKPILGIVSAFTSLLGFGYWAATGDIKTGALIRDGGGIGLDAEQVLPHQKFFKRKNYMISGWTYLVGTIFDLLKEWVPPIREYCTPLSFLFDGIGRFYQGLSEHAKEQSNEHLKPEEKARLEAEFNKIHKLESPENIVAMPQSDKVPENIVPMPQASDDKIKGLHRNIEQVDFRAKPQGELNAVAA